MPRGEIEELLRDAHLVINYAIRVGKLPNDALPQAVHAVETASPKGTTQDVAALLVALNDSIQAIAPMTLVELRASQSPFDPRNQRVIRRLEIVFCLLAIALTIIVATFTEYLHRADATLKEMQQIQDTRPLDKLNALRKMVRFEGVLDKPTPVNYDQYHRAVSELKELKEKISGSYDLLSEVAENTPWSFIYGISPYFFGEKSAEYSLPSDIDAAEATDTPSVSDECDPKTQETQLGLSNYHPWLKGVITDLSEEICFVKQINLIFSEKPPANYVYQIQASITALSGWILPFLYGLLGASVFVIRELLNPRTPISRFFPMILRVALGGIAGIIIGWFWVPKPSKTAEIISITSIPFGLAFLTGFSIDVLFSLLDRFNRTISDPPPPQTAQGK